MCELFIYLITDTVEYLFMFDNLCINIFSYVDTFKGIHLYICKILLQIKGINILQRFEFLHIWIT